VIGVGQWTTLSTTYRLLEASCVQVMLLLLKNTQAFNRLMSYEKATMTTYSLK